ncbi:MAG: TonB-dependent receptor [Rhodothermaceae bacterium]|nr:TonB-dependent receptor [Rhodothermaceae bacterium]
MRTPLNLLDFNDRLTKTSRSFLLFCFLCISLVNVGYSQDTEDSNKRYTVDLRGIPLSDAFDKVVELSSINLALDFQLIDGKVSTCSAVDLPLREMLECLIVGTGLEIKRLPSGTFIVTQKLDIAAADNPGELTGRVVDFESGEPLISAHVLLAQANTGDITNTSGRFSFSRLNPGTYKIAVTYIGYQDFVDTVRVEAGENKQIELGMKVEPLISAPIIVNGLVPRFSSELLEADTLSTSVSASSYSGDVLRSVETVIGVHVGDAFADVHVQGGGAGEHQYRLDGAPVFVPMHQGGLVGPFSAFALDKFTVHKAGYGVTHGSSLSGVIEVNHRLTPIVGNRFDLQIDPLSVNALAMGSLGNREQVGVNWMVAGRQGLWSLYRPPALSDHLSQWSSPDYFLLRALSPVKEVKQHARYPAYSSRIGPEPLTSEWLNVMPANSFQDDFNFYDIHSALRIHLGSTKSIHASLYKGGNRLGDEEVLLGRNINNGEGSGGVEDLLTMDSQLTWNNTIAQVKYEHIIGRRMFAEWSTWYSGLDFTQDMTPDTFAYSIEVPPEYSHMNGGDSVQGTRSRYNTDLKADDRNSIAEIGFKSELNYSLNNKHFFTWGLESVRSESDFVLNLLSPLPEGRRPASAFVSLPSSHWRWTGYIEDSISFSDQTNVNIGLRLTTLDSQGPIYAEPRVAFRHDAKKSIIGPWAFRAAVGLYRQYVNQFDVASLNLNALFSNARFWLPVDETVNPSRSLHASGAFLFMPDPSWRVRLEGYYKWQPHLLVIDYHRSSITDRFQSAVRTQSDLLIGADGYGYGAAISFEKNTASASASARYEFSFAEQRIPNRFDGNYLMVPWNIPHRITTSFDVALSDDFTFVGRVENQIGRAWAYRDAYYNFLEPSDVFGAFGAYELSDPESHRLPLITKLDLGFSYTRRINNSRLQVRLDLANLLSNSNIEEWMLIYDESSEAFMREERTLTPFFPSLTVRFGW